MRAWDASLITPEFEGAQDIGSGDEIGRLTFLNGAYQGNIIDDPIEFVDNVRRLGQRGFVLLTATPAGAFLQILLSAFMQPFGEHASSKRLRPGNRLEKLRGDRAGQYSIRINAQWRICFVWAAGQADEVEITDYH